MPLFPSVTSLQLQAATAVAGYTLVNNTGNIITWTAPNDGQQHRVIIPATISVTSTETGGAIVVNYTAPSGAAGTHNLFTAGTATSVGLPSNIVLFIVEAGTAVTIAQSTALTGGAAVLWAEIWGS